MQGESFYNYLNFTPGEYMIVASSNDADVTDIDIYVYDAYGNLLIKDADYLSVAVTTFTVSYTQTFKVVVKNYSSYTPFYASKCTFFVAWR